MPPHIATSLDFTNVYCCTSALLLFFFWKNSLLPTAFTLSVCIYLTLIFLYTIWTVKEIEETTYCTPYFTSQGNSSWFQHAVAMVIHTLPWTFPCFPGDVAFTSSHMILLYCKVSADAHVTIIYQMHTPITFWDDEHQPCINKGRNVWDAIWSVL